MYFSCHVWDPDTNNDLDVNPMRLHFGAEGGDQTVSVITEDNWIVNSNMNFIYVDPQKGNGPSAFVVEVTKNTFPESRTGIILVNGVKGGNTASVSVYQEGCSYELYVSADSIMLPYEKDQIETINVKSNSEWIVTETPSFASVSPTCGYGNALVTICTKNENVDSVDYSGNIVIAGKQVGTVTVHVTQKCKRL